MLTRLTRGLDEDQKVQLQYDFDVSYAFRKRLIEVIEEDIKAVHSSMRKEDGFDAAWPYRQADRVAQTKVLERMKSILK